MRHKKQNQEKEDLDTYYKILKTYDYKKVICIENAMRHNINLFEYES